MFKILHVQFSASERKYEDRTMGSADLLLHSSELILNISKVQRAKIMYRVHHLFWGNI